MSARSPRSALATLTGAIWSRHDKHERWEALGDIESMLPARTFYRCFVHVWENSESNDLHIPLIDSLIERRKVSAARVMPCLGVSDQRFFDRLPDRFRVWRGTTKETPYGDYSWTTDRAVAVRFANRCAEATPAVATGWVHKADMLFATTGRNESEIAVRTDGVTGKRLRAIGPWRENAGYKIFAACQRDGLFDREMVIFRVQSAPAVNMTPQRVREILYEQVDELEALGFRTAPMKRRALLDSLDWSAIFKASATASPVLAI